MYRIDNGEMLKFFQSNEEIRFFSACCNIVYADENKVEFYAAEENKPDFEYVQFYEDSTVLKVYMNTKSRNLIEMACNKITEIYSFYGAVEVCLPDIDLAKINIIRKYFNISDICDCGWGDYALLSNEKLPLLHIPDKVEISPASLEQTEKIKNSDNDEWEMLPKRLHNIRCSDLLILLHKENILAGYLDAVKPYKNYYNIRNIFVHEDFRGNNFGSLLTIYYANHCIDNEFIPHYGAAMSKYSENVALKSGFEETMHYHFFTITNYITRRDFLFMEDIKTKQVDESENVNTFENVWAALGRLEKTVAETRADMSKTIAETRADMSKTIADLSKNLGGLGNLQGRLTEAMFEAGLAEKFYEIGFSFDSQVARKSFKENGSSVAEADFFLENGEYAMPVEIKTELSINDIDEHIERISRIRKYMDARNDNRKLAGAIAGGIVAENVMRYAHKKGLYVLTQTGDSVAIATVPDSFKRREW
jgi:hypothetical protein